VVNTTHRYERFTCIALKKMALSVAVEASASPDFVKKKALPYRFFF
jgi:hypothetical protein